MNINLKNIFQLIFYGLIAYFSGILSYDSISRFTNDLFPVIFTVVSLLGFVGSLVKIAQILSNKENTKLAILSNIGIGFFIVIIFAIIAYLFIILSLWH